MCLKASATHASRRRSHWAILPIEWAAIEIWVRTIAATHVLACLLAANEVQTIDHMEQGIAVDAVVFCICSG